MSKFRKSQLLMLSLLTILLIIAPLLSTSLRPTYIYFIINLLIIVLGAEAGLLSFFAKPSSDVHNDKKNPQNPGILVSSDQSASTDKRFSSSPNGSEQEKAEHHNNANGTRVFEKSLSDKIVGSVKVEKVKKCPSMPSLFFIGGGDNEGDDSFGENYSEDDEEEQEEVGAISGQELFAKAESFIGNFYKQLKMQREESWKRIHGFYQRAF